MPIADVAIEIPDGKLDVAELARRSGLPPEELAAVLPSGRLSTLQPDQDIWDLARDAAVSVLDRAGVSPQDVDLVLWAGGADWGRRFWSPAARVALDVGIPRAHCMELSNFCNAGMAALASVEDGLRLGRYRHALVLVADQLSRLVDHSTGLVELFNFADGAAAVLMSADRGRYDVVGSAHRTDARWADYYWAEPDAGGGIGIRRAPKRDGLGEAFIENFTGLSHRVLDELGASPDEVAWFLVTHGNQDLHRDYLAAMGADASRSVFTYDANGHLGGVDPLLALEGLEQDGSVRPGDLILVATAGSGFTFGITALRRR